MGPARAGDSPSECRGGLLETAGAPGGETRASVGRVIRERQLKNGIKKIKPAVHRCLSGQ